MSRLHGSVLPSLRKASATSLLKTDRFWVNLWKEEERARAVARPRIYEPLDAKATVEFRTLESALYPGWAPSSHFHCHQHLFSPSPSGKQGLPKNTLWTFWGSPFCLTEDLGMEQAVKGTCPESIQLGLVLPKPTLVTPWNTVATGMTDDVHSNGTAFECYHFSIKGWCSR